MEKFEHNDIPQFGGRESAIVPNIDHAYEVSENFDTHYSPEAIRHLYEDVERNLENEITKLKKYLEAKELEPKVASELSELLNTRPISGVTRDEKIQLLQKYEQIITFFEKNNMPAEFYNNAKQGLEELKKRLDFIQKIYDVSQNNPEKN